MIFEDHHEVLNYELKDDDDFFFLHSPLLLKELETMELNNDAFYLPTFKFL